MSRFDIILRRTRPMGGDLVDIGIRAGKIDAIATRIMAEGQEFDCAGKVILPGFNDHHIHLMATAARLESVSLRDAATLDQLVSVLRRAAKDLNPGEWVRAVDYDEASAGLPDRFDLDEWVPDHPVRMQCRTGALWVLNRFAIDSLGGPPFPSCVEVDGKGIPTGRIWRGDAWLRSRLRGNPPPLKKLSDELARQGITGVSDASVTNGPAEAAIFDAVKERGQLKQKLNLMGRENIPYSAHYSVGAVKLLFDERDLPDLAEVAARIREARKLGRSVAAHCVTATELAFYLAALDEAGGARRGDRVEHGSIIQKTVIDEIARAGLIVVTQPGFVLDRGDRYAEAVDRGEMADLYRLGSLLKGGVHVIAGSDAPYGGTDVWKAIVAARDRKSVSGRLINPGEAVPVAQALSLYTPKLFQPFGGPAEIAVGEPADLCLLEVDWNTLLFEPAAELVRATIIDGAIAYDKYQ